MGHKNGVKCDPLNSHTKLSDAVEVTITQSAQNFVVYRLNKRKLVRQTDRRQNLLVDKNFVITMNPK